MNAMLILKYSSTVIKVKESCVSTTRNFLDCSSVWMTIRKAFNIFLFSNNTLQIYFKISSFKHYFKKVRLFTNLKFQIRELL